MHAVNMRNRQGQQRTCGARTDSTHMMIICFDAGAAFRHWNQQDFRKLKGSFSHTRCALSCLAAALDLMPPAITPAHQ